MVGEMNNMCVYIGELKNGKVMSIISTLYKGACIGSVIFSIRYGLPWWAVLIVFVICCIIYNAFDD